MQDRHVNDAVQPGLIPLSAARAMAVSLATGVLVARVI